MGRGNSYQVQGQQGGVVLGAGDSATGNFRWLLVLNDAELGTFTSNLDSGGSVITGETLPAGTGIGCRFTVVAVTTGLVIAYYG